MAFGFFNRGKTNGGAPPRTARGDRVYAIGDIHGRFDLFQLALERVESHHAALPPSQSLHLVLLGDLVDRGPDSAQVLDYVFRLQQRSPHLVVLKGNHEEMMVNAANGEPGHMRAWLRSGGAETMQSFGIEPPQSEPEMAAATTALKRCLPPDMLEWLRKLPLTAQSGDYLFCHAGVRPGVPLKKQARSDLLWIREEFLGSERYHGAMVVHGHSVSTELEMRPNRIGIDTGAYRSGILSVLYLEDEAREVLSIREEKPEPDSDVLELRAALAAASARVTGQG